MSGGKRGGSGVDFANFGRAPGMLFLKSSMNMTLEEGVGYVEEGGDNSWGSAECA